MSIPRSLKRAAIHFQIPGYGSTTCVENKDCTDEDLRRAIKAAIKAFDAERYGKTKAAE